MYLLIFLAICGKCETWYQYRYQHPQGLSLRRGRRQQRGHPLQPDRPRGPQWPRLFWHSTWIRMDFSNKTTRRKSYFFPRLLFPPITKFNRYMIILQHFLWYTLLFLKNSDRNSHRIYFWSKNFWTTMKILKKNAKIFCDAIFIFFSGVFFTIHYYIISWDKYEFLVFPS